MNWQSGERPDASPPECERALAENPARHDYVGRNYHIDPHPRFVGNEQYVVFTTTIRGAIDLAIVPTHYLLERSS